jgi:hypothetical protein
MFISAICARQTCGRTGQYLLDIEISIDIDIAIEDCIYHCLPLYRNGVKGVVVGISATGCSSIGSTCFQNFQVALLLTTHRIATIAVLLLFQHSKLILVSSPKLRLNTTISTFPTTSSTSLTTPAVVPLHC